MCVWLRSTRLETRTKECKRRASLWVAKPLGGMRVKRDLGPWRREPAPCGRTVDRSQATLWRDSSESVPVATRKMVNYA